MADLMAGNGGSATSHGNGGISTARPVIPPATTGSPGIRGPREIMRVRAEREARQRAEAEERARAEDARLTEESQRRNAGRRAAGVAAGQAPGQTTHSTSEPVPQGQHILENQTQQHQREQQRYPITSQPQHPRTSRSSAHQHTSSQQHASSGIPPPQEQPMQQRVPQNQQEHQQVQSNRPSQQMPNSQTPGATTQPNNAVAPAANKSRGSFPHAFERWETLSAHWEGLTSYWIRKLEQNKEELSRDPISQQAARQVTDLSAAGANLFHAVVELQRLRASSERKFQRWFFESRAELERAHEVNAMLRQALEQENKTRADAIQEAVQQALERDEAASKAQKQVAELKRELDISKQEARRAWEELGRKAQEERDRTLSLQSGQPTIVGGVQVVPMTQSLGPRQPATPSQTTHAADYGSYPGGSGAAEDASLTPTGPPSQQGFYASQQAPQPGSSGRGRAASDDGVSEGEYVVDVQGNFLLDRNGNRIPFRAPPSTYSGSGSDFFAEEYETPATTNPPSGAGLHETPTTSAAAAPSGQWTGAYSDPAAQDYTGQGYGQPGWGEYASHHHPTRLSDVIEEDDERSRTSASQVSRA